MLQDALETWHTIPGDQRRLSDDDRRALTNVSRWEDAYPEAGLVLEVIARDLPRAESETDEARPPRSRRRRGRGNRWYAKAWNRDWVWFRRDEAAAWLPTNLAVGATRALDKALTNRLVRLHLVDFVRGQTSAYPRDSVEDAQVITEITALDGDLCALDITGSTSASVQDGTFARAMRTSIDGEAVYDLRNERFLTFNLYAAGERRGRTRYNGRHRDLGPAPIAFALRIPPAGAPRVAPAFVYRYGWQR